MTQNYLLQEFKMAQNSGYMFGEKGRIFKYNN